MRHINKFLLLEDIGKKRYVNGKIKNGNTGICINVINAGSCFATQVYEESENITDTESVVGQDLTEKTRLIKQDRLHLIYI